MPAASRSSTPITSCCAPRVHSVAAPPPSLRVILLLQGQTSQEYPGTVEIWSGVFYYPSLSASCEKYLQVTKRCKQEKKKVKTAETPFFLSAHGHGFPAEAAQMDTSCQVSGRVSYQPLCVLLPVCAARGRLRLD